MDGGNRRIDMKIKAYAKINLTLDILGRRADGYHLLSMIMQSIGLYDTVCVEKSRQISVSSDNQNLPLGSGNIAYAAASLFFEYADISGGAEIQLQKNIPMAAGLGGGSADAAAVLIGLNQLYGETLTLEELCEAGLRLGADVPFCLRGGTMLAQGIGETLQRLPDMPGCGIVLVKPCAKPSTGEMYRRIDAGAHLIHPDNAAAVRALERADLSALCGALGNSFDAVWNRPELTAAKEELRGAGALGVSLSGSGPTVFGIFKTMQQAEAAAVRLKTQFSEVFAVLPVQSGYKRVG